jgi:hypothetical protein
MFADLRDVEDVDDAAQLVGRPILRPVRRVPTARTCSATPPSASASAGRR